ncbi:hypothetical protein BSKO_04051 [Bryopsis sp. KO-2023]|nr:hypothetical protein BSKO_04051 [Bryopsis sp. KO-2023]
MATMPTTTLATTRIPSRSALPSRRAPRASKLRLRLGIVTPTGRTRPLFDVQPLAASGGGGGGDKGSSGGNSGGGGGGEGDADSSDDEGFGSKASILTVYGIVIGLGGIMGYLKKRSKKSLMAGLGSAVAILACARQMRGPYSLVALIASLAVSSGLTFVMGKRAYNSKKFMPAGLVSALSAIVFMVLVVP